MLQHKSLWSALITMVISAGLRAQVRPLNDSAMTVRIHRMSGRLVLSPRQEEALLSVARQQSRSLDSLRKSHLTFEQRKAWIAAVSADNERQLKSIFTPEQGQRYDKMIRDKREAFLKHAGEKNIKVQETKN